MKNYYYKNESGILSYWGTMYLFGLYNKKTT